MRKWPLCLTLLCIAVLLFTTAFAEAEKEEAYHFTGSYTSQDKTTVIHYILRCYEDGTLTLECHQNLTGTWTQAEEGLLTLQIGESEYTAKKSEATGKYAFRYLDTIGSVEVKIRLETAMDSSIGGTETDAMLIQAYKTTVEDMARRTKGRTGEIVFYGGSNLVRWETLEADMAPYPVQNKSFGGSNDATRYHYMADLVYAVEPAVLVLVNDTNNWTRGQTLEEVIAFREQMLSEIRATLPDTIVVYLSNTPNPLRYFGDYHEKCVASDQWTKEYCESHEGFAFVDIVTPLSLEDGTQPNPALWVEDSLHLNSAGYALLAETVHAAIDEICADNQLTFGSSGQN